MARWTGTWLSGLAAAGIDTQPQGGWRGRRLGLPPEGVGAVATAGPRIVAFAVDALASGLVAALFITDPLDSRRGLLGMAVLALEYLLLASLTGQTLGMRMVGVRIVHLAGRDGPPGLLPVAVRTALLLLLVPALISDRDGRGLHDKAAGTAVVQARARRGADDPPD